MPLSAVIWANPEFVSGDYLNRTLFLNARTRNPLGRMVRHHRVLVLLKRGGLYTPPFGTSTDLSLINRRKN